MRRAIFASLSIVALSAVFTAPAFALTQRFQQAHRETLNSNLTNRFQDAQRNTLNSNLTNRFQKAYRENLNSD